jgi:hypothetical protein
MTKVPTLALTRAQLLEVVAASPARVGGHDKAGWLALFATDAVVEDPVGTRPQRRGARPRGPDDDDELGRFYEVFIAPNQIRFDVRAEVVAPPFVARDVRIHTRLPGGHEVEVPAHIVYEVCAEGGAPKIKHLAAYWELRRVPTLALGGGLRGLAAVTRQTWRMVRVQRLGGLAGYVGGFCTAGRQGRRLVQALARAVGARDAAALAGLFVDGTARVEFPAPQRLIPGDFLDALGPTAALEADDLRVAGRSVSCGVTLRGVGGARRGIAVIDCERRPWRITRARFFVADPADPVTG